jgi:hypothetical protein
VNAFTHPTPRDPPTTCPHPPPPRPSLLAAVGASERTPGALLLGRLRVERRARGSGSSVMTSSCEGCWRRWELRTAVSLVRAGQLLSGAAFLKCGAHALLGSLPSEHRGQALRQQGRPHARQRVSSAALTAMRQRIRRVTASARSTRWLAALLAPGPRLVHFWSTSWATRHCRSPRESGPNGHALPGPPPGTGAVASRVKLRQCLLRG